MICHKSLEHGRRDNCLMGECSLWEEERMECSQKTYYRAWGHLYALQLRTLVSLDKLDESLKEE